MASTTSFGKCTAAGEWRRVVRGFAQGCQAVPKPVSSPVSFHAEDVGIKSFFGRHPGFAADFQKHAYDFLVRELDSHGVPVKLVAQCTPMDLFTASQSCDPSGHVWFTVAKQKQTTPEALTKLAKAFQAPTKIFSFCGMKDRWGITTQRISFPSKALSVRPQLDVQSVGSLVLGDASPEAHKARLGGHAGNEFTVVLRSVRTNGGDGSVDASLHALRQGFPNYFGMQRFGTGTMPSSEMGIALLQGNFQRVVELLLGSRARRGTTLQAFCEASKGNFREALALTPTSCLLETAVPSPPLSSLLDLSCLPIPALCLT